jgi:glutamate-1-semialdehyde aminotransferase
LLLALLSVAVAALLQLAVKALPAATSKTTRAKIIHFSSFYHPHATFFLIPFMAARRK